jgi:hypothetical protein
VDVQIRREETDLTTPGGPSDVTGFGETAKGLAKNPLGVIALFIVLVYALAVLVLVLAQGLTAGERIALIAFLIGFPVLVFGTFTWIVVRHGPKLYSPADFKNEDNYVRMQLEAVASLTAATKSSPGADFSVNVDELVALVQRALPRTPEVLALDAPPPATPNVLWVDDRPGDNVNERRAFEAIGIRITLAISTADALTRLESEKFDAIISDMGRVEGPNEGYVLLDAVRERRITVPYFIYAGSRAPDHQRATILRGGSGTTNRPDELFEMVTAALGARRSAWR